MHSWRLMTLPHYRDGKMLINGRHQFSSTELLMTMPWWDLLPSRDQGMPKPSQGFLASKMHHPHPTLHPSTLLQAPVFSSAWSGFQQEKQMHQGLCSGGTLWVRQEEGEAAPASLPFGKGSSAPKPLGKRGAPSCAPGKGLAGLGHLC